MRIGCGLRVHRIDGNEYLYFWHYERENGRSRRREDYVGPARDPGSRQNGGRNSPTPFSPRPPTPPPTGSRSPRSPAPRGPAPPSSPPPPPTQGGAAGRPAPAAA